MLPKDQDKAKKVMSLGSIAMAVEQASKQELQALSRIEKKLPDSNLQANGNIETEQSATESQRPAIQRFEVAMDNEQEAPVFNVDNPPPIVNVEQPAPSVVVVEKETSAKAPMNRRARRDKKPAFKERPHAAESRQNERAGNAAQPQVEPLAPTATHTEAQSHTHTEQVTEKAPTDTQSDRVIAASTKETMTHAKEAAITSEKQLVAMQTFEASQEASTELLEGIYRDSRGQLRQANGSFASRKQKELYEQQQAAEEEKQRKDGGALSAIAGVIQKGIGNTAEQVDAVDTLGASIGNTQWAVVKEVKGFKDSAAKYLEDYNLTTKEGRSEAVADAKGKFQGAKQAGLNAFRFLKNPRQFMRSMNSAASSQPEDTDSTAEVGRTLSNSSDSQSDSDASHTATQTITNAFGHPQAKQFHSEATQTQESHLESQKERTSSKAAKESKPAPKDYSSPLSAFNFLFDSLFGSTSKPDPAPEPGKIRPPAAQTTSDAQSTKTQIDTVNQANSDTQSASDATKNQSDQHSNVDRSQSLNNVAIDSVFESERSERSELSKSNQFSSNESALTRQDISQQGIGHSAEEVLNPAPAQDNAERQSLDNQVHFVDSVRDSNLDARSDSLTQVSKQASDNQSTISRQDIARQSAPSPVELEQEATSPKNDKTAPGVASREARQKDYSSPLSAVDYIRDSVMSLFGVSAKQDDKSFSSVSESQVKAQASTEQSSTQSALQSEQEVSAKSSIDTVNSSTERRAEDKRESIQREAIETQTATFEAGQDDIVSKLDDVEQAIKGIAGGGGSGVMDVLESLGDRRRSRRARRGRFSASTAERDYRNIRERRAGRPRSRFRQAFDTIDGKGRSLFSRGGAASESVGTASRLATGGKSLLSGAGKLFKPLAAILSIGAISSALASGDNKGAAEETGGAAGGIGGAIAGGAAGAAIGSVVPLVGTLFGGIIGSVFGGIGGDLFGRSAGGSLFDWFSGGDSSESTSTSTSQTANAGSHQVTNQSQSTDSHAQQVAGSASNSTTSMAVTSSENAVSNSQSISTAGDVTGGSVAMSSETFEAEKNALGEQFKPDVPEKDDRPLTATAYLPNKFYKAMDKIAAGQSSNSTNTQHVNVTTQRASGGRVNSESKPVTPQIPTELDGELRREAMDIR